MFCTLSGEHLGKVTRVLLSHVRTVTLTTGDLITGREIIKEAEEVQKAQIHRMDETEAREILVLQVLRFSFLSSKTEQVRPPNLLPKLVRLAVR